MEPKFKVGDKVRTACESVGEIISRVDAVVYDVQSKYGSFWIKESDLTKIEDPTTHQKYCPAGKIKCGRLFSGICNLSHSYFAVKNFECCPWESQQKPME